MKNKDNISQYIAEFIGTFTIIFFGCGSMIQAELNTNYSSSFIPIIWGWTVSIMIYAVGHISGAHFNPAVTIAFWSTKRFPIKKVIGYLFSQFFGAIVASCAHLIIWGGDHSFGSTSFNVSIGAGFLLEMIISFLLMFVIVSVATDSRAVGELAGIAIGTTVAIASFVVGPLTNASMNPARTLAPAILSGNYTDLWLYFVAPIIGAVLGAKTYEWIRCQRSDANQDIGCC